MCKSYVVFALLPAQCAVCVSAVLCSHYCQRSVLCVCNSCVIAQCTASTVCHVGATISPPIIILFCYFYYFVFALLPAQCTVCKSCVVFALLSVQGAVCVSAVLCLHYCQCSVLCV